MGAKRVSKQGVTVSEGNAIEVTNTAGTALFSVNSTGNISTLANLTAKGSILTASAANTPAALAVGNAGETLVADSSATTGLRWQGSYAAGKNAIINGGFDIWQRGTSFGSLADGAFFADRWAIDFNGSGATRTLSRQEIAGAWNTSSRYFLRYNQSVAGTGGTYNWFHQRIEDVTTFAGQNVTVSFYAKADANRSVDVACSQVFGSGGSSQVNYTFGTAALTTSWTKFSFTVTLGSMSGKTIGTNSNIELDFKLPLNTAMTIEIGDVQFEAASVATSFTRAAGTLAGELAACMRYYQTFSALGFIVCGQAAATDEAVAQLQLMQTMRVAPTITLAGTGNGTGQIRFLTAATGNPATPGTIAASNATTNSFRAYCTGATSAYTAGNATTLFIGGSGEQTVYTASAEL